MKNTHLIIITIILAFFYLGKTFSQSNVKPIYQMPIDSSLYNLSQGGLAIYVNTSDMWMVYGDFSKGSSFEDLIKNFIKIKFVDIGLNIVDFDGIKPYFYVNILILPFESNQTITSVSYSIIAGVSQNVILQRDKNLKDNALTWMRFEIGHATKKDIIISITKTIDKKVDEFIIEYLKANT